MAGQERWKGLFPATVLPFEEDYRIDEAQLRKLIRFLLSVRGVRGLVCNGHAGDVWALSPEEQRRVIEVHRDEVGSRVPVVAGLEARSTQEAIELAQMAKAAGADGLLVLPLPGFRGVAALGPDVPVAFFRSVASAVALPLIVFQYPVTSGLCYSPETLARLAEIDNIVAVKEAIWEIKQYERDVRALRQAQRQVSVLTANDTLLYASFLHGTDGALIGLSNLVPHWAVEMFEAAQGGDVPRAKRVNDALFPLVELLYHTPGLNAHAAIKEALFMVGVLDKPAVSRLPQRALNERDRQAIRRALDESGLAAFYKQLAREPAAVR